MTIQVLSTLRVFHDACAVCEAVWRGMGKLTSVPGRIPEWVDVTAPRTLLPTGESGCGTHCSAGAPAVRTCNLLQQDEQGPGNEETASSYAIIFKHERNHEFRSSFLQYAVHLMAQRQEPS